MSVIEFIAYFVAGIVIGQSIVFLLLCFGKL